jgi:transcriptional regulator with XRE-family HTH domain
MIRKPSRQRGRANMATRKKPRTALAVMRAFFEAVDRSGRALDSIGAQIGVSAHTLTRWRHGTSSPSVADFEAALQAFGCKLRIEQEQARARE